MNCRLNKIRSIAGLSDALVEADPGHAADWYLDYGAAVEEILELGKRSPNLAMTCFDTDTISVITDKLPFRDILYIYDIELTGQAQLKEILSLIRRRKVNARKRARAT